MVYLLANDSFAKNSSQTLFLKTGKCNVVTAIHLLNFSRKLVLFFGVEFNI